MTGIIPTRHARGQPNCQDAAVYPVTFRKHRDRSAAMNVGCTGLGVAFAK